MISDNFIDAETVRAINKDWPMDWQKEDGRFTLKWNSQDIPESAQKVVDSVDVESLSLLFGIENLIPDPDLCGAGLHCIPHGGFLNMHTDFNAHPRHGWHRRLNMLIFLNEDWEPEWGGQLILMAEDDNPEAVTKSIDPIAGRCVIFESTENSWHGHPTVLRCPDYRQRRSLALYFYTEDEPEDKHSTVYIK